VTARLRRLFGSLDPRIYLHSFTRDSVRSVASTADAADS